MEDEEEEEQVVNQPPPINQRKRKDTYQSSSASTSYFESSSDYEDDSEVQPVLEINQNPLTKSQTQLPQIFKKDIDFDQIQKNQEGLVRKEFGGIIVYDSCARMIGNSQVQQYFEQNPPKKVDLTKLFSKEELAEADLMFNQEARERDFQNEFDKFLFKHLPKFQTQRDFEQPQYTINVPQQENILIFDSKFENGNLRRAIKVNNVEYNLWLENDLNTKGHTQWYYFKVIYKYPKSQKIQFNILNLMKPQSLYQQGMKPWIYSKRQFEENGRGWFNGGEDIKYFQNEIPRNKNSSTATYNKGNSHFLYNNNGAGEGLEFHFTLSFWYEFEYEEDELLFAHAIPYTYTDLQENLLALKTDEKQKEFCKVNILCKSLAQSPCPLLTITENVHTYLDYQDELKIQTKLSGVLKKQFKQKYQKAKKLYRQSLESKGKVKKLLKAAFEEELNSFYQTNEEIFLQTDPCFENYNKKLISYIEDHHHKKAIIITSRVHPGEPQSSQMLQGFIDFLVSDQAVQLRKNFVFRIAPMLNVDGVIYGNYRCSLLGVDLNRKWVQPNKFLHPPVYYAKQMIKYMHHERRVLTYCDLHGHSRKHNAFFYGCSYKNYEHEGRIKNAQVRLIPLFCCHKNNLFSFKDCRFRIEKCKEQTARVVIFREFNIMNSFTLESSFYGKEEDNIQQFCEQPEPEIKEETKSNVICTVPSNILTKKHVQQMRIEDYKNIGEQLAISLLNYLPEEQNKLDVLSGKILEIFYEEFVKFIPPYVLKREEERKKQLQTDVNQQANIQQNKKLSGTSPRNYNGQNTNIKKPKRANIQKQTSMVDKTKIRKRKTINFNKKDQNFVNEDKINEGYTPNYMGLKQNETEENFSEIIQINSNQEDILDLEFFIKKERAFIKMLDDKRSLRGINEEDDDDLQDQTDSSDSEASAKEFFTQHQQEEDKQYYNIIKSKKQKQVTKKISTKKKGKQNDLNKDGNTSVIQNALKSQEISRICSYNKQKPLQSLDDFKEETKMPGATELYPDTVKSNTGAPLLFFEKITHRKCSSPEEISQRNSQSSNENQMASSQKSRNIVDKYLKFEEIKQQQEPVVTQHYFHSLDDQHVHLNLNRKVLPLYENAEYHCQRLQQNIITNYTYGEKNASQFNQDSNASSNQSPDRNFMQYLRPNTHHDIGFKPRQMIVNEQVRKTKIKNPYLPDFPSKAQNLAQSFYNSNASSQQKALNQVIRHNSGLRSGKNEYSVNVSDMMANQNLHMQRVSFKELLETSRLNRETVGTNIVEVNTFSQHLNTNTSQLFSMIKGTYQRFQQAYYNNEDDQDASMNCDKKMGRSYNLLNSQEKQSLSKSPLQTYKKIGVNPNRQSQQQSFHLQPQPTTQREQVLQTVYSKSQTKVEQEGGMISSSQSYFKFSPTKPKSILYQQRVPSSHYKHESKSIAQMTKSDLQNYQRMKQIQHKMTQEQPKEKMEYIQTRARRFNTDKKPPLNNATISGTQRKLMQSDDKMGSRNKYK